MENKNLKGYVVGTCVLSLAVIICIITEIIDLEIDVYSMIEAICDIICLILSFIYLINGYSKDFRRYYSLSMYVNSANALVVTALSSNEETKYISVMFCALSFGLILVLAIAKDLGRKKSLTFCSLIVLFRVLGLLSFFIGKTVMLTPELFLVIAQVVLAIVILISTYSKYEDKRERNTK